MLKDQISCRIDQTTLEPLECGVDTGIDNTNNIVAGDVPVVSVCYERDSTTPYYNAKAVVDRALAVGVPAAMITLDGPGHVNWDGMIGDATYLSEWTTALFDLITTGSEGPAGCV